MEKKFGNPLGLLEKLIERSDSVELLTLFLEACRYQEVQFSRPRLVAKALEIVRRPGIVNPPFFKDLKDEEIQAFIDYYNS
jgi:hypothetical protein